MTTLLRLTDDTKADIGWRGCRNNMVERRPRNSNSIPAAAKNFSLRILVLYTYKLIIQEITTKVNIVQIILNIYQQVPVKSNILFMH